MKLLIASTSPGDGTKNGETGIPNEGFIIHDKSDLKTPPVAITKPISDCKKARRCSKVKILAIFAITGAVLLLVAAGVKGFGKPGGKHHHHHHASEESGRRGHHHHDGVKGSSSSSEEADDSKDDYSSSADDRLLPEELHPGKPMVRTSANDIRLVGGNNQYEGRVELLYNGQWGTICDDKWGGVDGEVACRQLGYGSKRTTWREARFGEGTGPIWMDNLRCYGTEDRLDQCRRYGGVSSWGQHNCDHSEDASVRCFPPVFLDACESIPCQNGGSCESEYGVFVCTCPEEWGGETCEEASSCASSPCMNDGTCTVWNAGGYLCTCPPGWAGRRCGTNKDECASDPCQNNGECVDVLNGYVCVCTSDYSGTHCENERDTGDVSVRLVGGTNYAGRVEVLVNGVWGSVCDDQWDLRDATVVCNELGYAEGAVASYGFAEFGQGSGSILLDNVDCDGSESRLLDCAHGGVGQHNCDHSEDAGVMCYNPNIDLRADLLNTGNCGSQLILDRIVAGQDADEGEWPWAAYLKNADGYFTCGAALVNNEWAVTAAHCRGAVHSIVLGDIRRSAQSTTHFETTVTQMSHPEYNDNTIDNDIMLLKLDEPVQFNHNIQPLCFSVNDNELERYPSGRCYVIGWGALEYDDYTSNHLQELATNLITSTSCASSYTDVSTITDNMLCTSTGTTSGSCQGDSGGPLMCRNSNGKWHLVGVTSHGIECARIEYPDVLARVSRYSQWIWQTVDLYSDNSACSSYPCRNEGVCQPGDNDEEFTCDCADGWTGSLCDLDIDECATTLPCVNGACINQPGGYRCECDQGYQGQHCENEISSSGNIRLVDGTAFAGRVEVFINGEWGSVCDDSWDVRAATVVCRELGFAGGAVASYGVAHFGQGSGSIVLDDVQCDGSENSVLDCNRRGDGQTDCTHSEDAGVMCRNPNLNVRPDALSNNCGSRPSLNRIVNGQDADEGEWPWAAYLKDSDGAFRCGAALVNNEWAISAAHCKEVVNSIVLGDLTLFSASSTHHESTVQVISHPNYDTDTIDNDIMLLKLDTPVSYNNNIQPVCLGVSSQELQSYPDGSCHVIGWGALDYGGFGAENLQELGTNLITNTECNDAYGHITDNMICSRTGVTSGSCQGDSGGPFMCTDSNGVWHLVGVTSHGFECANLEYPDVLARVSRYPQWILQTIDMY